MAEAQRPSFVAQCMEVVAIGSLYIMVSAGLIDFNKYLMAPDRFPHSTYLTAMHMGTSSLLSLLLYTCCPQLYPTMRKSRENSQRMLTFMLPLGALFATSLICANTAYMYSSVSFLQFCKEGNVVLAFGFSCMVGLQTFSLDKCCILAVILTGCSICASGEVDFVLLGLAFQLSSQVAEVTKNLIGETVLTGAGLKLDPMTFVAWQAPCAFAFLLCAMPFMDNSRVWADFRIWWPVLLANACVAFALNLTIALTIKRLSTVSFMLIGMTKDMAIVMSSFMLFGVSITSQQTLGFALTICGILGWGRLKMTEQASKSQTEGPSDIPEETDPLLSKSNNESAPETV